MGRDRDAVAVMRLTGAKYMTALVEVRRRRLRGEIRAYMEMVAAHGDPGPDDDRPPRCVTCLALYAAEGSHECAVQGGIA